MPTSAGKPGPLVQNRDASFQGGATAVVAARQDPQHRSHDQPHGSGPREQGARADRPAVQPAEHGGFPKRSQAHKAAWHVARQSRLASHDTVCALEDLEPCGGALRP